VRAIGHRAKEAEGFILAGQRDVVGHAWAFQVSCIVLVRSPSLFDAD
jgi:hypothetical protein